MMSCNLSYGDGQAHLQEESEETGARGIHEQMREGELRSGKKGGGAEKKSGAGKISGNAGVESAQTLSAANADFASGARGFAIQFRTKGAESDLGVVAGAQRLLYSGFAFGKEPGQQNTGLHLCAGDWHFVIDGFERSAFYV